MRLDVFMAGNAFLNLARTLRIISATLTSSRFGASVADSIYDWRGQSICSLWQGGSAAAVASPAFVQRHVSACGLGILAIVTQFEG